MGNTGAEGASRTVHGYGPRPAVVAAGGRPLSASRARLLEVLRSREQPQTLAALSTATGLHVNTVREHVEGLVARGLVDRLRATPHGRGRPAWLYSATTASATGDSEYAALAATLAAHIARTSPTPRDDAVSAGHLWGRDLATRAGPPTDEGSRAARRKVLVLLESVGFEVEADDEARAARLTRCPLLDAARAHTEVVCGVHLGIVRGALAEHHADASGTALEPFAEPGACLLRLAPPEPVDGLAAAGHRTRSTRPSSHTGVGDS